LAKKEKIFDFKELERVTRLAYVGMTKNGCDKTRTAFYSTVKDLAYAILYVNKWGETYSLDIHETAYEYSVYLFERVMTEKFIPKKDIDKFPWIEYIKLNIKHVIHTSLKDDNRWQDLISDFQFFVDNETEYLDSTVQVAVSLDDNLYKTQVSRKIYDAISIFYSREEIARMMPMAMEVISNGTGLNGKTPPDLQNFCVTLVALSKRCVSEQGDPVRSPTNASLQKMLKSSLRSSIFLSAVANSDIFPKELLLTQDIDSLYRLVQVCGGQTIRIPYVEELDSLLCAVVAVSKIVMEGKEIEKAISDAKENCDLVMTKQINIKHFVAKLTQTFDTFTEDKEQKPLIELLLGSLRTLNDSLDPSESQDELSGAITTLSSRLASIPKLKGNEVQYG